MCAKVVNKLTLTALVQVCELSRCQISYLAGYEERYRNVLTVVGYQLSDETAELVDHKVPGRELIDVHRDQLLLTRPSGVSYINIAFT